MAISDIKYQQQQKKLRERKINKTRREKEKEEYKEFRKKYMKYVQKFEREFKTENICEEQLKKWRGWPNNFICTACGKKLVPYQYEKNSHSNSKDCLQCPNPKCKKHHFLITNTLFHKTHTPLRFWFLAILCFELSGGKASILFLCKRRKKYTGANHSNHKATVTEILEKIQNVFRDPAKHKEYLKLIKYKEFL